MKIGIPKETHLGERRVAATPATVVKLLKLGFEVQIQSGAGESAHLLDADFVTAGASDDAQCTISMTEDDFLGLWTGSLPGPQAFMMGKLKIDGDMGLAMKLQSFLGA